MSLPVQYYSTHYYTLYSNLLRDYSKNELSDFQTINDKKNLFVRSLN